MKRFGKIIGLLFTILIIAIIGILIYLKLALPDVGPAPDIEIEQTAERVEHGQYLANHLMSCMHCHTPQDKSRFGHPMKQDSLGAGGVLFGAAEGLPGEYYAPNLTPFNLGQWTDGEIFRAITSGVNKEGEALFPIMPHPNYGQLQKEDIYSIIAYLRTLEPIENDVPESTSHFPMNFIINTIPKPATHNLIKNSSDLSVTGKYLAKAASCIDCHSPVENGARIPGMEFAGGMEFKMIDGSIVRTANITPDKNTGIGNWSEDQFVNRFKEYADSSFEFNVIPHGQFNTAMPWQNYAEIDEKDLKAIFAYLKTVEPVSNEVTRFTPVSASNQ